MCLHIKHTICCYPSMGLCGLPEAGIAASEFVPLFTASDATRICPITDMHKRRKQRLRCGRWPRSYTYLHMALERTSRRGRRRVYIAARWLTLQTLRYVSERIPIDLWAPFQCWMAQANVLSFVAPVESLSALTLKITAVSKPAKLPVKSLLIYSNANRSSHVKLRQQEMKHRLHTTITIAIRSR